MIRIVVVDDQALIRVGIARILGHEDGFEVVAECEDGDEVAAAVAEHRPDVVLMDVRMRRVDGLTAIRELVAAGDPPAILVLTTFDDDDVLWGALDSGAAGFVLKDASAEDLIAATRAVAGGAAWLDAKVAPRHYVVGYAGVVLAQLGLVALPLHVASRRELGVTRRYRASGVGAGTLLASQAAVGVVLGVAGAAVVLAVGGAVYGIDRPEDPLAVAAWFGAGLCCFVALGIALGTLMPGSRTASAAGNLVFVPMFLLGGGGPPRAVMTGPMQAISDVLPLSHVVGGLRLAWLGGTDDPRAIWWTALVAAAAVALALRAAHRRAA